MYFFEVTFKSLHCFNTESIHSSDKFAMAGTIVSTIDAAGMVFPLMRINDGESRDLSGYTYTIASNESKIAIAIQSWDLDENDGWTDNKDDAIKIAKGISDKVKDVPVFGSAIGGVIDLAVAVIPPVVDQFVEWDHNDPLINYKEVIEFPGAVLETQTNPIVVNARHGDSVGYSNFNYSLEFDVRCSWEPTFGPTISDSDTAMNIFRARNQYATKEGFLGAFPNFFEAHYGLNHFAGTMLIKHAPTAWHPIDRPIPGFGFKLPLRLLSQVEWRDVPLNELGNPSLEDFGLRMRNTQDYAIRQGFVGGFPTFFHADYGKGIVCGTILLREEFAERRDIPYTQFDEAGLKDIGARFRATHDYAVNNGFIGGFPNFYHADYPTGRVGGSILIKAAAGEWREVLVSVDPK